MEIKGSSLSKISFGVPPPHTHKIPVYFALFTLFYFIYLFKFLCRLFSIQGDSGRHRNLIKQFITLCTFMKHPLTALCFVQVKIRSSAKLNLPGEPAKPALTINSSINGFFPLVCGATKICAISCSEARTATRNTTHPQKRLWVCFSSRHKLQRPC